MNMMTCGKYLKCYAKFCILYSAGMFFIRNFTGIYWTFVTFSYPLSMEIACFALQFPSKLYTVGWSDFKSYSCDTQKQLYVI